MDRVLLGKAPANDSPYYHRDNGFGLFVSKPGANVYNCSDGDLIFDSNKAGLLQPLARGAASIPKAEYNKGLYGEEGVINESNWDSSSGFPVELNSDTSWVFDAVKQVNKELISIRENTQVTIENFSASASLDGFLAATIPDQTIQAASQTWEATDDLMYFRLGNPPPLFSGEIRGEWRGFNFVPARNYTHKALWSMNDDAFEDVIKGLSDIGSDTFIRTMIKDLWRIHDVFTFLPMTHVFGQTSDIFNRTILGTNSTSSNRDSRAEARWTNATPPLRNSDGIPNPNWPSGAFVSERLKTFTASGLHELLDPFGDFTSIANFHPIYYLPYRPYFTSENLDTVDYSKIGYGRDDFQNTYAFLWRAWTTPGEKMTYDQEIAAIAKFNLYRYIFGWMNNTYGPAGHLVNTQQLFNYYLSIADTDTRYGYEWNYHFDSVTTCPIAYTDKTQYWGKTDPNFGYSYWDGGDVDVDTGVSAPNDLPVQVWWNPVFKSVSNTSTNLTFLNDSRNRVKETRNEKRKFALVPGITTIHANTYVDSSSRLKIRFSQPSTLDESQVFFTAYKETAWLSDGSVSSDGKIVPPDPSSFVQSFVFDIRDLADGGDNRAGRKSEDGRYYGVVFPDDFIGERGTATDPFAPHRNGLTGPIDDSLLITINIPENTVLSGNAYYNHITRDELVHPDDIAALGAYKQYGPLDSNGRTSSEIYAANDPCLKLNLNSGEFTDAALSALAIRIENRGTMVGGGGWGQYGQMMISEKFQEQNPGGGGGGGAGYHPTLELEDPTVDWMGSHTTPPTTIVSPINTDEEMASAQTAQSTHWNGPNNYVEWGYGGSAGPWNAFTNMNIITFDSIGPGKPGTGYLGSTPEAIVVQPPTNVPFADFPYATTGYGSLTDAKGQPYYRLAGTYNLFTGATVKKRFAEGGWGNHGVAGTTTAGGAGGAKKLNTTFGYGQWVSLLGYDPFVANGSPMSGSGGSCVYVYANTETNMAGAQVQVINMNTGIMKAGGGGGSGGRGVGGLGGGNLGRPGKYVQPSITSGDSAVSGEGAWNEYTRRGEPGRIVWWNSETLASNYSIENNSTKNEGAIEGLEYNSEIGGDDYVTYTPDIMLSVFGSGTFVGGQKLWSRRIEDGVIVYNDIEEKTYEEYVNSDSTTSFT